MEKNSRVVTGAWERIPEADPGSRSGAGERKQSPEAEAEPRRESGSRSEDQKQAWNQMQSLEVEVEPGSESRSEPGSKPGSGSLLCGGQYRLHCSLRPTFKFVRQIFKVNESVISFSLWGTFKQPQIYLKFQTEQTNRSNYKGVGT